MNKCVHCQNLFKRRYSKHKFCSISCANRYNLNNKTSFQIPTKLSEELAELFGILLGDGSVTKYYVKIYLNLKADKGYASNIVKLIKVCFPGIKATVNIREKRGTEEIQISSKNVCDYLREIGFSPKERYIPSWITENNRFTKAAIRGLFDAEGSIGIKYFNSKSGLRIYKQLTFTNTNNNILKFVYSGLKKFGFSPTKNYKKNIYLSNKNDIEEYFELIGTSNPKLVKKMKLQ